MFDVAKWYLIIGLGCSFGLIIVFLLFRHRIENPITINTCFWFAGFSVLVWPLLILILLVSKGNIMPLLTDGDASQESFAQIMERTEKELQHSWQHPPPCGQYISAHGLDEANYKYTAATFIFKSNELVEQLGKDPLSQSNSNNQEAKITAWLTQRDQQLRYCTIVPKIWRRMPYVISKAIDQNIGECYCPQCSTSYAATALLKPEDTSKVGWSFNTFYCPKNHLLHRSKGVHFYR